MTAVTKTVQVRKLASAGFSSSMIQEVLGVSAGFCKAAIYAPGQISKAQGDNLESGSVVGWKPSMTKAARMVSPSGSLVDVARLNVIAAKANVANALMKFQGEMKKSLNKSQSVAEFVPRWTRELVAKGFSPGEILKCFYPESHDQVRAIIRQLRG